MTVLRSLCKGKIINPGDYYVDHHLVKLYVVSYNSSRLSNIPCGQAVFSVYTVRTNLVRIVALCELYDLCTVWGSIQLPTTFEHRLERGHPEAPLYISAPPQAACRFLLFANL